MGAGAAVINGHEGFTGRDTQEGSCVGCACSRGWGVRRGGGQGACTGGGCSMHVVVPVASETRTSGHLRAEGGRGGWGGEAPSLSPPHWHLG
jgi:hypothetical protein